MNASSESEYIRYNATGNSFILIRQSNGTPADLKALARRLCPKIGVDGLLVMDQPKNADWRMRIINPDGSEADMCGNGSRCAAHWVHHHQHFPSPVKLETGAGVLEATVRSDTVKIKLTNPKDFKPLVRIRDKEREWAMNLINTGVPHAVIESHELDDLDIAAVGRWIRRHEKFKPEGTNVTFFQISPSNSIRVRTYERGVEGETLSCGTGSTAAVLIASLSHPLVSPVRVVTRSGGVLLIHFDKTSEHFTNVFLEGPVEEIGAGKLQ